MKKQNDYQLTNNRKEWGSVTGVIFFYNHRAKSNGLYPLKIRLTHKRERTYYDTGFSLSEEQWKTFDTARGDVRKNRTAILEQMELIGEHVKEMNKEGNFSFELLAAKLGRGKKNDVFEVFESRIKDLRSSGFVGNAMINECALNCLKSYTSGSELPFEKITPSWLEAFDEKMRVGNKERKGISTTTRSMYLRCLRATINASGKFSPFSNGKFKIKSGGGRKLAITKQQINDVFMKYQVLSGSTTDKMRDLFYFSYLTNGLNIKDMLLLKWSDIQNDEIHFIRSKTARLNQKEIEIVAPILPQTRQIIDKWGQRDSKFIFGYINDDMTPQTVRTVTQNVTRLMNKHIKLIADATGLPHISTYTARFSYATNLLRSGAPIEFISGQMGHSKISTTQAYLQGYQPEARRKYNEALTVE